MKCLDRQCAAFARLMLTKSLKIQCISWFEIRNSVITRQKSQPEPGLVLNIIIRNESESVRDGLLVNSASASSCSSAFLTEILVLNFECFPKALTVGCRDVRSPVLAKLSRFQNRSKSKLSKFAFWTRSRRSGGVRSSP